MRPETRTRGNVSHDGGLGVGNDVQIIADAGAPTNGTTGATWAGIGTLYVDKTAGKLYINTGTMASPTWTVVGSQS